MKTFILELDVSFPIEISITPTCQDFIARLLTKDRNQRPSCKEMLKHEWLSQEFMTKIKKREVKAPWIPIL